MRLRCRFLAFVITVSLPAPGLLHAQDDATEREVEKYRQMLKADPWSNPGLLDADRGEALWKEKRGPKNASLGAVRPRQGPGQGRGRLRRAAALLQGRRPGDGCGSRACVWCMEKLQGFDRADIVKRPYSKANQAGTELEALATYVAYKSNGLKFAPQLEHAKEREALALGEALFFRRQGPMDFSCATCHADSGKRIRLQGLPFLGKPEEARKVIGEWPAYRVSQGTVMTMQHRIADCYWQMRLPLIDYGSDVTVALTMYPRQPGQGRRDHRAADQALGERPCGTDYSSSPSLRRLSPGCAHAYLLADRRSDAAACRRRHQGELDDVRRPTGRRGSCRTRRRRCAASIATRRPRRSPMPSSRARRRSIKYPADGKLMGDWKKGEQLAQSGYGGRFTDYPPRPRTAATAMPATSSTRRS